MVEFHHSCYKCVWKKDGTERVNGNTIDLFRFYVALDLTYFLKLTYVHLLWSYADDDDGHNACCSSPFQQKITFVN